MSYQPQSSLAAVLIIGGVALVRLDELRTPGDDPEPLEAESSEEVFA